MRTALLAVLMLVAGCVVACDEDPQPSPISRQESDVNPALQEAARRECAELTGYAPDRLPTLTTEMQALVTREYNLCVEQVSRGDKPELRGRSETEPG